jgi:FKBP-type peptidyl-prolyl cis-trans isomerase
MIRFVSLSMVLVYSFTSCSLSGTDKEKDDSYKIEVNAESLSDSLSGNNDLIIETRQSSDTLFLEGGIYITYFKKGEGALIQEDDVVLIDYKSKLTDGKVFDTNEKIGKPIPFMVGWSMQTSGWDIALTKLREGDEVSVFLPAKYARGDKGIPDLVPPGAVNIIELKIHAIKQPEYTIDGVEVWVINRGSKQPEVKKGDELLIDYFANAKSNPRYDNSFKSGQPYQIKVGGNNLPGLNMGLLKAKLSDKLWIRIPAKHAFGTQGNHDLVKPNETIFFDLRVLKILDK